MTQPPRDLPTDAQLHALYREGQDEALPGPALDRRVRAAAHAAVREAPAGARQAVVAVAWWRAWRPLASVLAAGVIGLAVTVNVMQQQQSADMQDSAADAASGASADVRRAPPDKSATEKAPAAASGTAGASSMAPVVNAKVTIQAAPNFAADATPNITPKIKPNAESKVVPNAEPNAEPTIATRFPSRASGSLAGDRAASVERAPVAPELNVGAPAAAHDVVRPRATTEIAESVSTGSPVAGAAGDSGNQPAEVPGTVEHELARIRALARAGKLAEARELIRRLRQRDPAVILPGDIEALQDPMRH